MKTKLALAGSIILLTASLGQAAAGPRITDKSYWPNEVGPSAYRLGGPYASASSVRERRTPQRAHSEKRCTYQGGPKSNLWTCR